MWKSKMREQIIKFIIIFLLVLVFTSLEIEISSLKLQNNILESEMEKKDLEFEIKTNNVKNQNLILIYELNQYRVLCGGDIFQCVNLINNKNKE